MRKPYCTAMFALTTTTLAGLRSPQCHSMASIPSLQNRSTILLTNARNGATKMWTPLGSNVAGSVASKVFPPPVGTTTISGVSHLKTADTAWRCSSERNWADSSFSNAHKTGTAAASTSSSVKWLKSCLRERERVSELHL